MIRSTAALGAAVLLAACAAIPDPLATPAPTVATAAALAEDQRLTALLDRHFDERAALNPLQLTSLGLKDRYGELGDYRAEGDRAEAALVGRQLAEMRAGFDPARLSPAGRVSLRMAEYNGEQALRLAKWRDHDFLFSDQGTPAGAITVSLINNHRVDTVADAEAYLSRLRAMERAGREIRADFEARAAKGITPPSFVFEPALLDMRKLIRGAPYDGGPDSAAWADFKSKIGKLSADEAAKARLLAAGRAALLGPYRNGVQQMIASVEAVRPLATSTDGVWRLPNGEAYYADQVRASTTTELTPDEIHRIGLAEVARIRARMEAVKRRAGFEGTLDEFFAHVETTPRLKYPNTPEGRELYLKEARGFVAQAMAAAPRFFHRLPKAPLEVRAVEPWRESTASIAFYSRGTPDGSRPGIYYANLADMTQVSRAQVETRSYHEGAPGHHFQNAFAQEQTGLPKFRRFGGYGAYGEGWGLYSEKLGKEMGFFQDPYSEFGGLSTELWRAVRLVVDTGLHSKRWSRERAVAYLRDNSLLSERDVNREINRYITNPGQATSYKIGELKISELRGRAERELGPRFDVRDFHAVVLDNGSMPLAVLEQQVEAYIAAKKGSRRPPPPGRAGADGAGTARSRPPPP